MLIYVCMPPCSVGEHIPNGTKPLWADIPNTQMNPHLTQLNSQPLVDRAQEFQSIFVKDSNDTLMGWATTRVRGFRSGERSRVSKSTGGGGDFLMAVQKRVTNEGIPFQECVSVCGSAHSNAWLTFSLAQYQWVTEANRRWRLRRRTNYQQVIGSALTRSIPVFVRVYWCVHVYVFCAGGCSNVL